MLLHNKPNVEKTLSMDPELAGQQWRQLINWQKPFGNFYVVSFHTAVMFVLESVVSLNMFRLVETCPWTVVGMIGFWCLWNIFHLLLSCSYYQTEKMFINNLIKPNKTQKSPIKPQKKTLKKNMFFLIKPGFLPALVVTTAPMDLQLLK